MKLQRWPTDPTHEELRIRDLRLLLEQPSYQELRPCPGCVHPCPCSQSPTCTCMCGPDCVHAPVEMSSDGQQFPIEEKIVTMVFAFNCLRVCPPYWSCEGHAFPSGELFRVPQVWFYSRSLIYPKLIGDLVHTLHVRRTITNPWHVRLAFAEDSLETGFCIEPNANAIENPSLETMQADAQEISQHLTSGLRALAQDYMTRINRN